MSCQFVTMPCSMGYLRARTPRLACASSPTRWSFLGKSVSVSEATCYAASRQSRGESKLHSAVKLLVHADHDARHLRAPDDGRKDCSGSVVAREPCLPGALMGRETDSKRKTLHHGSLQGLPCTCRCHCQPQELQPRLTWLTPCSARGNRA